MGSYLAMGIQHLKDVSQGTEPLAVTVETDSGHIVPPFQYIKACETPMPLQQTPEQHGCGANCTCTQSGCFCFCGSRLGSASWSTLAQDPDADIPCVAECGPACHCWESGLCRTSFTQSGVRVLLSLRLTHKGWGLVAGEDIEKGQVICPYAGEILRSSEADRRLKEYDENNIGHALLVVRQHLPSGSIAMRYNIDATFKGNCARFINHRCGDPNAMLVIVWACGALHPAVAVTSRASIAKGEEITISYGEQVESTPHYEGRFQSSGSHRQQSLVACLCSSAFCKGYMPLRGSSMLVEHKRKFSNELGINMKKRGGKVVMSFIYWAIALWCGRLSLLT